MANVSRVQGLRAARNIGTTFVGALESFSVLASDGTAIYIGDVVKSAGTADANGQQAVTRLTANTDAPTGVVVGVVPTYSNLNTPVYRPASTAGVVFLITEPLTIYEVQANAATALADIGLNVGLTFAAGSAVTGQSAMIADMSTKAVTATLPLKIVGVVQRPDQDMSDSTNWKLLVQLNTANFSGSTVGTA